MDESPTPMTPADTSRTANCPFCEAEIGEHVRKCRHCGEWVARNCQGCETPLRDEWAARGICAECRKADAVSVATPAYLTRRRNKTTAIILAGLLGGLGVHRFYLGRPGSGILYLIFFWTFIPVLLSLAELVRMAMMEEEEFDAKYSR